MRAFRVVIDDIGIPNVQVGIIKAYLSNYIQNEDAIGFAIPLSFSTNTQPLAGLISLPVDERDVPPGIVHLVQKKGRVLSVAAAKFMDQMVQALNKRFPEATR